MPLIKVSTALSESGVAKNGFHRLLWYYSHQAMLKKHQRKSGIVSQSHSIFLMQMDPNNFK